MLASGPYNQAAFLRGKWVQPEGVLAAQTGPSWTPQRSAAVSPSHDSSAPQRMSSSGKYVETHGRSRIEPKRQK
jgi:hypothetical protein